MIYVLFILMLPQTHYSGKAVHTQEFTTQAKCEAAAAETVRRAGNDGLTRTWCMPK